ncbi:tyrosine-type recombinase/integrase [Paraburkholderia humisilvae]|uniref:Tyrosine recombinase XerC n=1 Tax=Paraburkholderia humisilvae TaxID=627669 RepID=A0A6J5F641_9BURK|nr:site-specific integrase [Paraburkholderia humisilvae]CAB3773833.1 Tyrosine recombinase XerC [Paraburkholderia humisilvae]
MTLPQHPRDPVSVPNAEAATIDIGPGSLPTPLERVTLRPEFSGSHGENRALGTPAIAAHNDLQAVRAWLDRYAGQPKTLRAYSRELERFLLWAICVRGTALSAVRAEDCEAYKQFLQAPAPSFTGPRANRTSGRWRPFALTPLLPESRRYAVRTLRAAFAWLVDVRYLAANPWKAVRDPAVTRRETSLQTGRALPEDLWQRLREHIDMQCERPSASYWRTVRAVVLLCGDCGLRRDELTQARREELAPSTTAKVPLWTLTVPGKPGRRRTVPVSPAAVVALRAHWRDLGLDLDAATRGPLIRLQYIPPTPQARKRHGNNDDVSYSPDGINRMLRWATRRLIAGMPDLTPDDRQRLASVSPHALRHTFGTRAAAHGMPLEVLRCIMGHRSLETTTSYAEAGPDTVMQEAAQYHRRDITRG